jgi:hypothetical protein
MRRTAVAASVSVSKIEAEASVTAMALEIERQHDLPSGSEDNDMGDDKIEELFGRGAVPSPSGGAVVEDPIDLEGEGDAAGAEEDGENEDDHVSRPSTFDVWEDFQKLFKMGPKGKKVRYGAICIHCKKRYSGRSLGGTGHLCRHRDKCVKRREKTRGLSQSQISFNPDGSMCSWDYCPMCARTKLCRLLSRVDFPISFGEYATFEDYIVNAHNPKFKAVSTQTTTRDFSQNVF